MAYAQQADNYPPDNQNVTIDSTNLPIVWIDVNGVMIDREERITGHMKIIHNGDGMLNYADTIAHPGQHIDYEGYIAIRYRGHSSFLMSDKKPYSFHTMTAPIEEGGSKKKVELLGMGKDNKWCFLAPYSDRSLIRDIMAFEFAKPWMEYTPQGRFCEVYLDGIYYGVYQLCEVVSKGKYRTNLPDPGEEGDELTGGYIMQVDRNEGVVYTSKHHPVRTTGWDITDRYITFQFQTPDTEDITDAQKRYITGRIDEMENAFASSNYMDPEVGYQKYIDVTSFADYQLMTELSHNIDGYRLSAKFFKRRDSVDARFKMVIWDFNIAFGNSRFAGFQTDNWIYKYNNDLYSAGEVNLIPFWWYKLNKDPNYTSLLKERWKLFRRNNLRDDRWMATVDSLANVLTSYGAEERNDAARPRWGKYIWPNYHIPSSYDDEIAFLKQWITDRIAWMDQQLGYEPEHFIRGDVNGDGTVSISDISCLIDYLLGGDTSQLNLQSADCNNDSSITIADVSFLIDYLLSDAWPDDVSDAVIDNSFTN
jgi:hypothetical protein